MSLPADEHVPDAGAFAGYRLLAEIERRPELGVTYRAHDQRRDAAVELTVIATALARDARYRDRLERRHRLHAALRHPALVAQIETGERGDRLIVVTDAMPGAPLRTVLGTGPLSPDRALSMFAPIAELLDRLQAAGLPAGDLSPWTVAVDPAGRASLTRVGLAGVSLLASARLEVSAVALTYSAPELLRGLSAGPRTDVYGLATLLFEAITGRPAFAHVTAPSGTGLPLRAALARRAVPPPSVSARRPGVGPQFDAVLKAALSESPATRPDSAGELVERLARALEQAGGPQWPTEREARRQPTARTPRDGGPAGGAALASQRLDRPPATAEEGRVRNARHGTGDATPARRAGAPAAGRRARRRRGRIRESLQDTRATAPAAAVAMLAGVMLAVGERPARPAEPAPHALHLSAGVLRIAYPSTWQPERNPAGAAALSLGEPAALVPLPGVEAQPDSRLLAGLVTETGPALLHPELERRLGDDLKRETVRLGTHEAYRYRDVALGGQGIHSTVYAVPTSAGVVTLACFSPRFVDTLDGQCEAMATTLSLTGARSLPLGPNAEYGRLVSRIVAEADTARRQGRIRLRLAKRAPGQGRRAADLASVFRRAAERLASSGPEPGAAVIHRELVASLREVRNAYESLARAAASGNRGGYDAARRVVSAREAGLARNLERMRRLGYQVD